MRINLFAGVNGGLPKIFFILLSVAASVLTAKAQKPELVVQTGHTEKVASVAFSPDGRTLASGSGDSTIKLWNIETGQVIRTLSGHTLGVASVAFSPDGKTLASGGIDSQVKIWNVDTGQNIRTLSGHTSSIVAVAFSPDGKTLASGSGDNTIKLWNADTGQITKTLIGHKEAIRSIAFSPGGKTLISSGGDSTIKLWNVITGQIIKTFSSDSEPADSVAFSPDGKSFAWGDWDTSIKLSNVLTGQQIKSFEGHSHSVNSLTFSPDGKTLASGSGDNTIKLWNVASGKNIKTLEGHGNWIESVAFSSDGKTLASGSDDQVIKLWSVETGQELKTLSGYTKIIGSIAFSPDSKMLASGSRDNTVKLWDLSNGQAIKTLAGHKNWIESVAFSPDGKTLASGSIDASVKLWSVESGQELRTLSGHKDIIHSVVFSPDGKTVASGGNDNTIKLWNAETGQEIKTLAGRLDNVTSVAFSPDGKILASGDWNNVVKLWNAETGEELKTLAGHTDLIHSVAFSPDGKTLASGSHDRTIKLWNTETGQIIRTLSNPPFYVQWVASVAFSPDGKTLASGGGDGTVKLWNAETGEELKTLASHSSYVSSVTFSPDGRFLSSGSSDGTIKLWNAQTDELLATLVSFGKKDWVVVTPDGYFDGTPNGWRLLSWRLSPRLYDIVPVEAFFNEFFRPNLLADLFAEKIIEKPKRELSAIDIRQPEIRVSLANAALKADNLTERQIAVNVTIKDAPADVRHQTTGGAKDVRLFRNGSLVRVWRGDVLQGKDTVTLTTDVSVVAGDNILTAYAFNNDNVKSGDGEMRVRGADSLKRDGTLYILAVGVNKYENSAYDLNFAVPDTEEIGAAVKVHQDKFAQNGKFKQYGRTEIVSLTDEMATKANILSALGRFVEDGNTNIPADASDRLKAEFAKIKPLAPEDALIVDFSGHGTSQGQRFYLLPHNFTGAGANPLAEAVSDEELGAVLERIDAGKLLMIVDACQSGQALGEQNAGRGPMNSKGLAQLAYDKGMLILTAAQSQQAALEAVKIGGQDIKHGLLTFSLLAGLTSRQADTDANGALSEREWFDYAVGEVPRLQIEAMKERSVEIKATGRGSQLVFVNGDNATTDPTKRQVQTPRVFYRRETETQPLVVAAP